MRLFVSAILLACGLAFGAQASAPVASAQTYVDKVAADVLKLVQDEKVAGDAKKQQLNKMFADVVDVPYVARFVLGRNWRTASAAQQQAYLAAYGPFLINNYVARLSKYTGQSYKITGSRADGEDTVVNMDLLDPNGPPVKVDYRVHADAKATGGFKVIDIIVEGVSLLATQRSEFNSVVNSKGIDFLIEALKKKANS